MTYVGAMSRAGGQHLPITSPASAAVFLAILTQGPLSRVSVARLTGLSPAAVTKAAKPFIEAGYLVEMDATERNSPGAGRPATPLAIRPDREFFAGVKITEDEIIGVITNLRAEILTSRHRPLRFTSVDFVIGEVAQLVADLLDQAPEYRERTDVLGVAMSGDVDQVAGLARYSPFLHWHGVPVAALAEEATGLATVVDNDVRALTTAEHWFGAGVGTSNFAVVTVGTGIGCGLVVNDEVISGAHGVSGEIGHVPVGGEDVMCHCGSRGCVEAIAATAAIVQAAQVATGKPELTFDDAVTAAHGGDEAVRAVFARAGRAIGLGMAAMANLIGPERIVVTGDGAGIVSYELFGDQVKRSFASHAFGAAADCELLVRPLPFEEWAQGAAAVGIQRRFQRVSRL